MHRTPLFTRIRYLAILAALGLFGTAFAQQRPASQPTTAPAETQPLTARVIEIHGDVQHATLDSSNWQPCKLDDEYPQETKIRTGLRSSIKLQIGRERPYTALLIESVGLTYISEAYKTTDSKRVRIGVGYGKIRAGVAEGGLKSDFTVDSPVATLSKRGTWNFGLSYERGTDRFQVFLLDQGLVDALNKLTGYRRALERGELVTQAMRRWLDQAQILRNVPVPDILGQGDIEVAFNRIGQAGLGVTGPGQGRAVLINLSNSSASEEFARLIRRRLQPLPGLPPLPGGLPRARPEGFFGTGRGDQLIDIMIDTGSSLSQNGFAKPGTYNFRRSALETWLQSHNQPGR
jgi:hypothetical protein